MRRPGSDRSNTGGEKWRRKSCKSVTGAEKQFAAVLVVACLESFIQAEVA